MIELAKDCSNAIEDVFLHVRLEAQGGQIGFADDLEEKVKNEIIKIIEKILEDTHNFPRPENHMARAEKTKLWDIPEEDEVYSRVKREVGEIIDINIRNIEKVLDIYNKY